MKLSLGIVGLPNVGKSTLFNALTKQEIAAENYPFCTIDPNVGVVPVADPRLQKLSDLINPEKTTPAVIEFWDIAGLVKGASQGEGLGNQFLANIRSVSAIVHVVRSFVNDNIHHVENNIDPKRDIELINIELIFKDLETVQKKTGELEGKARADHAYKAQLEMLQQLKKHLEAGELAKDFVIDSEEKDLQELFNSMFLLTAKPTIYLVNSPESQIEQNVKQVQELVGDKAKVVGMDIKLEAELAGLEPEEQAEYLQELGLEEPALNKLTREAYALLGLQSFFTAGEQEVRAWTIPQGATAPEAAGAIHGDFQKKFITAEVVPYAEFIDAGGWSQAKEEGKIKLAGKDYTVQDGEVIMFKHNA